jgi:hypothetical protein
MLSCPRIPNFYLQLNLHEESIASEGIIGRDREERTPCSRIVAIGSEIDAGELDEKFDRCLAT